MRMPSYHANGPRAAYAGAVGRVESLRYAEATNPAVANRPEWLLVGSEPPQQFAYQHNQTARQHKQHLLNR